MVTFNELKQKSAEEIREINKKLSFDIAKKIAIGVVVTVVTHVGSEFVIGKLEQRKAIETTTED